MLRAATPERLSAFSDAVFAVLITVLVLDLRPPELPTYKALLLLWPTWLSYAVSYLFIAIVWANHHHLMRYATTATPRLMWFNFAHLFSVSLLPLSTAWRPPRTKSMFYFPYINCHVRAVYLDESHQVARPVPDLRQPGRHRREAVVLDGRANRLDHLVTRVEDCGLGRRRSRSHGGLPLPSARRSCAEEAGHQRGLRKRYGARRGTDASCGSTGEPPMHQRSAASLHPRDVPPRR